jgi:hypothetical protein
MDFRQSARYAEELAEIIAYYTGIDSDLGIRVFQEPLKMESYLASFPEAAPLTSAPPIRKFILPDFPLRIRYIHQPSEILLLTLDYMKQDKPL